MTIEEKGITNELEREIRLKTLLIDAASAYKYAERKLINDFDLNHIDVQEQDDYHPVLGRLYKARNHLYGKIETIESNKLRSWDLIEDIDYIYSNTVIITKHKDDRLVVRICNINSVRSDGSMDVQELFSFDCISNDGLSDLIDFINYTTDFINDIYKYALILKDKGYFNKITI